MRADPIEVCEILNGLVDPGKFFQAVGLDSGRGTISSFSRGGYRLDVIERFEFASRGCEDWFRLDGDIYSLEPSDSTSRRWIPRGGGDLESGGSRLVDIVAVGSVNALEA